MKLDQWDSYTCCEDSRWHLDIMLAASLEWPFALRMAWRVSTRSEVTFSVTPSPVQSSCVSRSWPSTNSGIGSSWDRSINSGNHDAAGCSWAIKITSTPGDLAIFCSTCGTILNDGNAYKKVPPVVPRHEHGICPLRPGIRIGRYELDESSVGECRKQVDPWLAPLGKHRS